MSFLKKYRTEIAAVAFAALFSMLAFFGAFFRLDSWMSDSLYQNPKLTSGNVTVVGIDDKTLEALGPFQRWPRRNMANALEALARDKENLPAVVAIDTLYYGHTDTEDDLALAEAAAKLPVVITADFAEYSSAVEFDTNGEAAINRFAIKNIEEPFKELKDVTVQGNINAMADKDGILRHALLYLSAPNGETIYSMAARAALEFDGGITLPETGSIGQFAVTYYGGPGSFYEGISLIDVINGEVDPSVFAGKIVFIGPYASGLQDAFNTPIARGKQMYGVEVQANVCEMLLHGDYRTEASDVLQAIVLFVVLIVLYILLRRLDLKKSSLVAVGALVLYGAVCYICYRCDLLLHPLWIPLGDVAVYVITALVKYLIALKEKQKVQNTFQRYVAPEIVSEILREGTDSLELGGKLCNIAVLFVDVRGFTTMSERLDPVTVVKILNKYLTMTSSCIKKNKGTLDKFVGDATMAFWGAPLPDDDAIYHAVRTALDIVTGADEVSKELKEELGEELHVGVGVHYGPAVVGNTGADWHMDYTAIGDTVNTSARLEANAPGGTVYISRVVADALGDRIRVTSLGDTVKLKGKAEGFEVLKVEELF